MTHQMHASSVVGALGRRLLFVLLAATCVAGCGAERFEIRVRAVPVAIGETTVDVVVHEAAAPGLTYLNLHDDENTAVEAALEVIGRHGGRVMELRHGGERTVTFSLGDSLHTFDPNRIFTDAGARATLERAGSYAPDALEEVRRFAAALIELLGGPPVFVTVHNNQEDGYGVLSYADGGELQDDVRFAFHSAGEDADDFVYVTDASLYVSIREAGVNVVLQDDARVTDDGSLSVYAGMQGIPYANVEAEHGHFEQQVRMLELVRRLVSEGAPGRAVGTSPAEV